MIRGAYNPGSQLPTEEELGEILDVSRTVVSRPTRDRGVLDCGSKVMSSDTLGLEGYGFVREYPQARVYGLSEEHGHVDFSACGKVS